MALARVYFFAVFGGRSAPAYAWNNLLAPHEIMLTAFRDTTNIQKTCGPHGQQAEHFKNLQKIANST